MANAYYTPATLTPLARARAEDINADRLAVEAGFDKLPPPEELREGRGTYFVATGSSSAYVGSLDPALDAYSEGLAITFKVPATNTGAVTLNMDGLGARALKRPDGQNPLAGALVAGSLAQAVYDGTAFVLLGSGSVPAVQSSSTDATAGRLLVNGSWGVGGIPPYIGDINAQSSIVSGTYSYGVAFGSTNGPQGVTAATLRHARRDATGFETQMLTVERVDGTAILAPGMTVSRARDTGAWGPWMAGDVVDSGTSINGIWERRANGLQTLSGGVTTSTGGNTTFTFAQPFSTLVGLSIGWSIIWPAGTSATLATPFLLDLTTTDIKASVLNSAGTRIAAVLYLTVTGRWA
jgi:hypothetical protein